MVKSWNERVLLIKQNKNRKRIDPTKKKNGIDLGWKNFVNQVKNRMALDLGWNGIGF